MVRSPRGSSVHGVFQVRILKWIAISFSRGSSQPKNRTQVSCIAGRFFTNWAMREGRIVTILWWFLLYINMNWPQVYMCPTKSWTPLPPPSLPYPSGLSQSTGFGCPVSCIEFALVICFTHGNVHVSTLFSQIIPPSLSPTESKSLFFTICVSFATLRVGSSVLSF